MHASLSLSDWAISPAQDENLKCSQAHITWFFSTRPCSFLCIPHPPLFLLNSTFRVVSLQGWLALILFHLLLLCQVVCKPWALPITPLGMGEGNTFKLLIDPSKPPQLCKIATLIRLFPSVRCLQMGLSPVHGRRQRPKVRAHLYPWRHGKKSHIRKKTVGIPTERSWWLLCPVDKMPSAPEMFLEEWRESWLVQQR